MITDTDNFCKSCDTCAKTKPPHSYTKEPLEHMQPLAREFGDRIHIDLLSMQNTIIPHFGCPKAVVTDLGVENKNSKVEQLLASYKIKHITSSRAHPQSNGLVERRQRMLLNYARLYSDTFTNQNLWHLRLPMCMLILNSTYSCLLYTSPSPRD